MIRLFIPLLLVIAFSCKPSGEQKADTGTASQQEPTTSVTTFEGSAAILLQQLRDQGDYVNSRQFPSMIKPETVYPELDANNLIIDLRIADKYNKGHIKGAVNVEMDQLLSHFENDIIPFQYDKIVLVCNGGQRSSYATQLLRLQGYGNVYSMRWGMSGWNSEFSGYLWERVISSEYQDKLVQDSSPKPVSFNQPVIASSTLSGEDLLRERVSELLAQSPKDIFISKKTVFENPEQYFIINLERRDKYESGHIPGAIRYKPQGTLGIPSEMGTLPIDQTIVIYCGTGMSSAFAAAYLRLFGYDARSMSYGNNSFMHQKMLDEKEQLSWHPFTESIPQELPVVK
jgi:rhodanese-related sulfurtransferase